MAVLVPDRRVRAAMVPEAARNPAYVRGASPSGSGAEPGLRTWGESFRKRRGTRPTYVGRVPPSAGAMRRRTRRHSSPLQIDRDALPLRITVEHALERVLASHAALLVPAVRLTGELAEALIDLHPAGFDRVRGVDRFGDVARPHVRREPVMTVVRHTNRVALVVPRNRDHHGAEDLFARDAPVVAHVGEHGRLHEIAARQRT